MGTLFNLTPPAAGSTVWGQQTLHLFAGPPLDGRDPNGPLALGAGGVFYGTTGAGGMNDDGSIFSLSPPTAPGGDWTETIIYNCGRGVSFPTVGVIIGKDGTLYGNFGGVTGSTTYVHMGKVFALHPPAQPGGAWTLQILHSFTGEPDGEGPVGTLAMDANGVLFGATFRGGASNDGMIYKLTPPSVPGGEWTETILHSFDGVNGRLPYFGVTLTPTGAIYGTTTYGGTHDFGTVYKIVP